MCHTPHYSVYFTTKTLIQHIHTYTAARRPRYHRQHFPKPYTGPQNTANTPLHGPDMYIHTIGRHTQRTSTINRKHLLQKRKCYSLIGWVWFTENYVSANQGALILGVGIKEERLLCGWSDWDWHFCVCVRVRESMYVCSQLNDSQFPLCLLNTEYFLKLNVTCSQNNLKLKV